MLSAHSTYLPKSPSLSNLPQSLTLPWGGGAAHQFSPGETQGPGCLAWGCPPPSSPAPNQCS